MSKALTIEARHERDYTIVTIVGEIDMITVTGLREQLFELAASSRPFVADLDQVSFIDSAGLGVLVGTANRAQRCPSSRGAPCCPRQPGHPRPPHRLRDDDSRAHESGLVSVASAILAAARFRRKGEAPLALVRRQLPRAGCRVRAAARSHGRDRPPFRMPYCGDHHKGRQ